MCHRIPTWTAWLLWAPRLPRQAAMLAATSERTRRRELTPLLCTSFDAFVSSVLKLERKRRPALERAMAASALAFVVPAPLPWTGAGSAPSSELRFRRLCKGSVTVDVILLWHLVHLVLAHRFSEASGRTRSKNGCSVCRYRRRSCTVSSP